MDEPDFHSLYIMVTLKIRSTSQNLILWKIKCVPVLKYIKLGKSTMF